MGRKCKEDADKTYGALLDAAEEIISERGYSNATFNEIACRAGLSRGAIYWHFKDKQALLEAILQRAEFPWDQLLSQPQGQPLTIEQVCARLGEGLAQITTSPRLARVSLILLHRTELLEDTELVRSRLSSIFENVKTFIATALAQRYLNADGSPHGGIRAASIAVQALMTGCVYEWLLNSKTIDLTQVPGAAQRLITGFVTQAPVSQQHEAVCI